MRLIVAGGGTGGHLFPGVAVAREFQRRDSMARILFVGSESGIERGVVPREGFPLKTLPIQGIKGRGWLGLMQAFYGIPASLYRSFRIVGCFRPQCIIGLGGYASGPLLIAGKLKGIRCAIMEQNVIPGLTNRVLAWLVDRIFTTYEATASYFPRSRVVETGNPVRWEHLPPIKNGAKFTLLIFGGSAGAHKINLCFLEALDRLADLASAMRIIHQTGQADFMSIQNAYASRRFETEVAPFIERMDEAYARADLVVCRAGATTVAELTAYGKPAILIPYPYAAHDHQRVNARAVEERGAAVVILDQELSGENLAASIRSLYADRARLTDMARAARELGRPEAAKRIVDECYALFEGRTP
ncbi:MAG: undecaprenyldiphospho-muramoylpentapeptide beta-N-acetylglucosaminyltransferase [Deltaproteobacteria bacterium]|nr:undecaprenyldiphospho-muramoylpentapeptide beta-N-acetylglucosaminyltransferase [Deltaproteobacteria bacterium]